MIFRPEAIWAEDPPARERATRATIRCIIMALKIARVPAFARATGIRLDDFGAMLLDHGRIMGG